MRSLVLAGLALLAVGCSDDASSDSSRVAPPTHAAAEPGIVVIPPDSAQLGQLRVAPVEVTEVSQDEIVAPARVGIDPNRLAKVLLPVSGRIVDVTAKLGDRVAQGQPLAAVESPDADAAVGAYRQAEAAERQAEATLTKADADYQRSRELREHGAVAQKDLLAAENDLAQARAALDTARVGREQARRKLELLGLQPTAFRQRVIVPAPINGTVIDVSVARGEYRNDTSAPLMSLADLTRVWVSAEVPEPAIRLIRAGDPVTIDLVAFPAEIFGGRVTRIADVVDPQTRTVKVHAELDNAGGRLRPDMFGTVRRAGPPRRLPVVPLAAVIQQYGHSVLFVERGAGRFERREVTPGAPLGDRVAVLAGLTGGERIVVDGAVLLKDR